MFDDVFTIGRLSRSEGSTLTERKLRCAFQQHHSVEITGLVYGSPWGLSRCW